MKRIKDFPNYRIHESGLIESCYKPKTFIVIDEWFPVKHIFDKSCGYMIVTLCHEGVRKNKRVHRLLAEAFLENPESKAHVNHIDGNKLNNDLSNLEWATPQENSQHSFDNGLSQPTNEKEIYQISLGGEVVQTFISLHEAGRQTGIAWQNISKVCRGLRNTAGGFKWRYK